MASPDLIFLYENGFHAVMIGCYNWLLDVFDNDNIMTENAFQVVQKIPTVEKDYRKCSLRVMVSI